MVPVVIFDVDEAEALALSLLENLQREDLNPFEETLGILDLLALELGRTREEVVGLLHRMRDEARGKVPHNVMGNSEAEKIAAIFQKLGRMTWESFVQNRLPLLTLPDDLKEALEAGAIPYTAALELKKVEDDGLRRSLLEEVKAGMPLRALREKVKELLEARREAAPKTARVYVPRIRQVARKLGRLKSLSPEAERALEEHLRAIEELT